MKKLIASTLAAAAIGFTGIASAETWSPTGTVSLENFGGLINVRQTVSLDCSLSGSAALNGDSAQVSNLTLTGNLFLCGLVRFNEQPYNLEATGPGTVALQNVRVDALSASCFGDLEGTFDQATGIITFMNASIPSDPVGGPSCFINGRVSTTAAASYTFP
ncbi:MAG: hypothetical protein K0U59_08495 [Gammaproteobacteria bacterium]|nr:hypothetical protein [Gammaproteobacteria bacterium]